MQDRFKFRCFNKFQNKMYDVKSMSYINGIVKRVEVQDEERILIFDEWMNNIDNTVLMACTGLKDKNGRLIYEGDILFLDNEFKGIAKRHDKLDEYYGCWDFELICKYPVTYKPTVFAESEIIGNIYENPELLEVK